MTDIATATTLDQQPVAGSHSSEEVEPAPLGWRAVARTLRRDRAALVGAAITAAVLLLALAAPLVAAVTGHAPGESFIAVMLDDVGVPRGPNSAFLLGADTVGRDLLVRLAYGTRTALIVGMGATALSLAIGVTVGLLSGYFRGPVDTVLSRITEVFLITPVLVLALGLSAACGGPEGCVGGAVRPGLTLTCFVIGATTWPYVARVVRSQVLSVREADFIAAARVAGCRDGQIIAREVLPNVMPTILVIALVQFPQNILYEASLAFLGIGVLEQPSWGAMLAQAGQLFPAAWWMLVFPALFLSITVLGLSLLGESLRDALDTRR